MGKKYFGSATDNPELMDASYVAQLSNVANFGQITPVRILSFMNETQLCLKINREIA